MSEERVQKIIARSGLCSRREAERLIREGRVTVNGQTIGLGDRARADADHIKVDGKALRAPEPHRYLLLYKPREVMTTCDDPEGRTTVIDLIRPVVRQRVFPVGRLDYHSEGLILLTNDGELAARVSHPRHGVIREYLVKVRGDLDDAARRRLMAGTTVDGRRVVPRQASRESGTRGGHSWWRIQVSEGRTHEVRELFFRAGHPVQRLRRTAIGPIRDTNLRPGDFRELTDSEIGALKTPRRAAAKSEGRRVSRGRKATGSGRPRRGGSQRAPGTKKKKSN